MEQQAIITSFDDLALACIARGRLEGAGNPCRAIRDLPAEELGPPAAR